MPSGVAQQITDAVGVPTIGIGAGPHCDGQVLVLNDVLGLTAGYVPRFVKEYASIGHDIELAVKAFAGDVRAGEFPGAEQAFTVRQ